MGATAFLIIAGSMATVFGSAAVVEKMKSSEMAFGDKLGLFSTALTVVGMVASIAATTRRH